MWKLIWVVLALVVLLSLLATVAYAFRVHRPVPAPLQGLHLDACVAPCWAGIRVGQTTMDEAFRLLDQTFSADPSRYLARDQTDIALSTSFDGQGKFTAIISTNRPEKDRVTQVLLTPAQTEMPLVSDVMTLLGPPTCISRYGPVYQSPDATLSVLADYPLTSIIGAKVNSLTIKSGSPDAFRPTDCR